MLLVLSLVLVVSSYIIIIYVVSYWGCEYKLSML